MRAFFTLTVLLALSAAALAALPPLSPEQKQQGSTQIVIGKVVSLTHEDVAVRAGTDRRFVARLQVQKYEKGGTTPPQEPLEVRFWQTLKRESGWAGPQGQNEVPQVGQKVRAWLLREEDGSYDMLMPNGWEPVR